MFTGLPLDRRAQAVLICHMMADRAENSDIPLSVIGEVARELADLLLDEGSSGDGTLELSGPPKFRVIEGGRG